MDETTGQQQAEDRIEHLNAVLRAIRNVNHLIVHEKDAERLLQQACEKLIETRGYYNAWIALMDESRNLVTAVEAGLGKDFDCMIELLRRGEVTACGRQSLVQPDVVTIQDPLTICTDCPLANKYSGRGAVSVRLEHEGHIYGLLSVSMPVAFCKDEEEQSLFKEIAEDLGFALHGIASEKAHIVADKALAQSEEKYRSLFENASDGIILRDLAGNIIAANQAITDFTGYEVEELQGMHCSQILEVPSYKAVMDMQKSLLESEDRRKSVRYELMLRNKEGINRTFEAITSLLFVGGQEPIVQGILRDVTDQRLAHEQMRAYASKVTQAQEEERKRIARELHDETVQAVANLGMEIDSLIDAHNRFTVDEVNQYLEEVRNRIDGILNEVRRVTQDLRPPMLDELGLIFALQWLADETGASSGIETSLEVIGDERRFSQWIEMLLFRIAQEALNNVRKHSGANKAVVRLEFNAEKTRLTIRDNGKGFKFSDAPTKEIVYSGKLGLVGMRERAGLLGSDLKIESEKGQGTTITVEVMG